MAQTAGVFVDVYVLRLDVQHVTLQPGETEDFRMVTLSELDDMGRRGLLAPHILRHLSLFEEQLRFFLEPSLSPGLYRTTRAKSTSWCVWRATPKRLSPW